MYSNIKTIIYLIFNYTKLSYCYFVFISNIYIEMNKFYYKDLIKAFKKNSDILIKNQFFPKRTNSKNSTKFI